MHKGYECFDVATGRIYISKDVVFDENVFNGSAQLRKELVIIPAHLLNPRNVDCTDPNITDASNGGDASDELQEEAGENLGQNSAGTEQNDELHEIRGSTDDLGRRS